ncbi:MAG: FkbM family methyltransferase [Coriobacteriia bacterium]
MSVKQRILTVASRLLMRTISIVGGNRATQISAYLAENLSPYVTQKTDHGQIVFFCPGKLPEWRARTLLTKEPETIEWIGTFKDDDVLWDIGANVGAYSLYAATLGHPVLSFEPSPSNYYLLSRNIEINRLDNKVSAYCIAFNDTTKLDVFFMANTELGGALNSFGEATDWQGNPFTASLKQAMVGFGVDDFIEQFGPPFPNHIKLDVDGIEDKIVRGSRRTLADSRLKSVLIELHTERRQYYQEVTALFERSGLRLQERKHVPESDEGEFSNVYNHIFVRPE